MFGNKLVVIAIALVAIVVAVSIAEHTPPPQGRTTRMSRLDKVVGASRKAMQRIAAQSRGGQDTLEVKLGEPAEEYEAVRGHDVEMTCGDGSAEKVNWYHDSVLIEEATFADWRFEVVDGSQNLHIYQVEESDAGTYECYSIDKSNKAAFVGEGKLKTISIWSALNPFG